MILLGWTVRVLVDRDLGLVMKENLGSDNGWRGSASSPSTRLRIIGHKLVREIEVWLNLGKVGPESHEDGVELEAEIEVRS